MCTHSQQQPQRTERHNNIMYKIYVPSKIIRTHDFMHEHWEFVAVLFYSWKRKTWIQIRRSKEAHKSRIYRNSCHHRQTATVSSWLNNIQSITLFGFCWLTRADWLNWTAAAAVPGKAIHINTIIIIWYSIGTYSIILQLTRFTGPVSQAGSRHWETATAKHGTQQ